MEKNEWKIDHLVIGLSIGTAVPFSFLYFLQLPSETFVTLALFNFLFASLICPLHEMLTKKIFILIIGNIVGLVWNYLFYLFVYTATNSFRDFFIIPYIILSPFINLVWIVSFWAVSLTMLASSKEKLRVKFDS